MHKIMFSLFFMFLFGIGICLIPLDLKNAILIGNFVVAKATPRMVTPPTARVPPTAASKPGINKGSTENNSHNNSAVNAQIDDLSNQVFYNLPTNFEYLEIYDIYSLFLDHRFEIEFRRTGKRA